MSMSTGMGTMDIPEDALYCLMAWLSPAYPIGGFSYSHGLEQAVEAGLVRNRATVAEWVETVLMRGAGPSDAALFAAAWRAAGDPAALDAVAERATAWRATAETALETAQQGAAFLATTRVAWPHPALDDLARRHEGRVALPVAVAVACAVQGVPLEAALAAYLQAFAANLVSAAVRLIPLGQSDGQQIVAALASAVAAAARHALATPLDDVGTAAPMIDWCSMRHETQYTRLFRS
jgi:urease accessory protein